MTTPEISIIMLIVFCVAIALAAHGHVKELSERFDELEKKLKKIGL